jgi:hypothetical protein
MMIYKQSRFYVYQMTNWKTFDRAYNVAQLQKERGFKGVIAATRKTTPGTSIGSIDISNWSFS